MSTPEGSRTRLSRSRPLWHLGIRQVIVTVVIVLVLNVVARRLGLGLTGSIFLCAAIALAWPFAAAWWARRRR